MWQSFTAQKRGGEMLKWEEVLSDSWMKVYRAKVPGGWFVFTYWGSNYAGQAFYPDPNHQWDGTNQP
jgi:hypothetical protein